MHQVDDSDKNWSHTLSRNACTEVIILDMRAARDPAYHKKIIRGWRLPSDAEELQKVILHDTLRH